MTIEPEPNQVADYGWTDVEGPHSCDYLVPEILVCLERLGVKRVLDLGAGNGKLCSELAKSGHDVVGMEYDQAGVDVAKAAYPSIPFYRFGVQDNAEDLIQHESKFEAVVSTEVIEHLFSPHLLPSYASQVLEDSGYLIISTPYHGYLKNLALSVFNKWDDHHTPLWHGGHIKFWSRKTMTQLLKENGFEVISFSGVGRVRWLWKSMILVAQKGLIIY